MQRITFAVACIACSVIIAGCGGTSTTVVPGTSSAGTASNVVFTETNQTSGNAILRYTRNSNGSLTAAGSFSTGGTGTGLPTSGLPFPIGGATGAVVLTPSGSYLLAVDAGSNDIATFSVSASGLTLVGRTPSNGSAPSSIAVDPTSTFVYVLNSGTSPSGSNVPGNISGFRIGTNGVLSAGSTQALSTTTYVDPSEVAFAPSGAYLVVTEKITGAIDIYPVNGGTAGAPIVDSSTGATPFGFAFTSTGSVIVANANAPGFKITANGGSLSSYTGSASGSLSVISGTVADDQTAPCWVAITPNGQYAYATNTVSGTVSGYAVGGNGSLSLLTSGGVTGTGLTTDGPTDVGISSDGLFLYELDSHAGASPGTIAAFQIGSNGSLTSTATGVSGLPPGTVGLAVR